MPALRTDLPTAFALLSMGTGLASCALIVGPVDGHRLFGTTDDGGVDAQVGAQVDGQASPVAVSSDGGGDVVVVGMEAGSMVGSGADAGMDAGSDASFQGLPVVLAANEGEPQGIAVAAGAVYWSNVAAGTLRKMALDSDGMPLADAGPTTVYSFANAGAGGAADLVLDGETLYALVGPNATSTSSCRTFLEMPLTNLSLATCAKPNNVCSTTSAATRLTVDSTRVFISDGVCDYVMAETEPGTVNDNWKIFGSQSPMNQPVAALASDGSYLYSAVGGVLYKQESSGLSSASEFLNTSAALINDLVTDGLHAYWITAGSGGMVESAGTQTPAPLAVHLAPASNPQRLAQDGTHVYWTNFGPASGGGSIGMAAKDGSEVRTIAKSQANPWGIAVSEQGVYWTDQDNNGSVMMLRR
jgi:hypothetical protein